MVGGGIYRNQRKPTTAATIPTPITANRAQSPQRNHLPKAYVPPSHRTRDTPFTEMMLQEKGSLTARRRLPESLFTGELCREISARRIALPAHPRRGRGHSSVRLARASRRGWKKCVCRRWRDRPPVARRSDRM